VTREGGGDSKGERRSLAGLDPLSGATVHAIDAEGRVSGCEITDTAGMYAIGRLGTGIALLLIDMPGYFALLDSVQFGVDNVTHVNVAARLQSTSSAPMQGGSAQTFTLHPNPATTFLSITLEGSGSPTTLRLIEIMGHETLVHSIGTDIGTTTLRLPLDGIAAGCYIMTIAGENGVAATPVVIGRQAASLPGYIPPTCLWGGSQVRIT